MKAGAGVSTLVSGAAHVVSTNTTVNTAMSKSIEPRMVTAARLESGAGAAGDTADGTVELRDTVDTEVMVAMNLRPDVLLRRKRAV